MDQMPRKITDAEWRNGLNTDQEIPGAKKIKDNINAWLEANISTPLHEKGFENLGPGIAAGAGALADMVIPSSSHEALPLPPFGKIGKVLSKEEQIAARTKNNQKILGDINKSNIRDDLDFREDGFDFNAHFAEEDMLKQFEQHELLKAKKVREGKNVSKIKEDMEFADKNFVEVVRNQGLDPKDSIEDLYANDVDGSIREAFQLILDTQLSMAGKKKLKRESARKYAEEFNKKPKK